MKKINVGINLKSGGWTKRVWFELTDSKESKAHLDTVCGKIDSMDTGSGLKELQLTVEKLLAVNGIFRIAK